VQGVRFVTFFTGCNFDKLLFTVEKGQGLGSIHSAIGELERVQVDCFSSFFPVEGEGGGGQCFFFPRYMKRWKEEGGKGYI